MADSGPIRIAVVCEAAADFRTVSCLADRVFLEETSQSWLTKEWLPNRRIYVAPDDTAGFLAWTGVGELAEQLGQMGRAVHAFGHFDGQPGAPYAQAARKALLLLCRIETPPDVVILSLDADDQPKRHQGLGQARKAVDAFQAIVIACADSNREAWLLTGFSPEGVVETQRLVELKKAHGFDPTVEAGRLASGRVEHKNSAKRVLDKLTLGDVDREERCLTQLPLSVLRKRGAAIGLKNYLDYARSKILPLLDGVAATK